MTDSACLSGGEFGNNCEQEKNYKVREGITDLLLRRFFTATRVPSGSWPRYTTPYPPSPNSMLSAKSLVASLISCDVYHWPHPKSDPAGAADAATVGESFEQEEREPDLDSSLKLSFRGAAREGNKLLWSDSTTAACHAAFCCCCCCCCSDGKRGRCSSTCCVMESSLRNPKATTSIHEKPFFLSPSDPTFFKAFPFFPCCCIPCCLFNAVAPAAAPFPGVIR